MYTSKLQDGEPGDFFLTPCEILQQKSYSKLWKNARGFSW